MSATLLLVAIVAVPVLAAGAIALVATGASKAGVDRAAGRWTGLDRGIGRWAARAAGLAAVGAVVVLIEVATGPAIATHDVGDGLVALRADRVAGSLAVLATGVGAVVISFAARALDGDPRAPRFFALALLLTGATATLALAASLVLFTVAWVVIGQTLAALVGHREQWAPARQGARTTRRYLAVGDACMLAATATILLTSGPVDVRALDEAARALQAQQILGVELLPVAAVLLALAGVSRSALVPLHRWLPATIVAPTPVSAMLHAGVVNGAGVLLVTMASVFGTSALATGLLVGLGLVTVVYATAVMRVRTDVKGALAWSTAGQMGFMAVQLAVGAFGAALFHLVGHGLYKAALFLGSGGAITSRRRHGQRPSARHAVPVTARRLVSVGAPGLGLLVAFTLFDPHLPPAGTLLVVVFAWLTAARATDGWLRRAPYPVVRSGVIAILGAMAATLAYVAGLTAVEGFWAPALPPLPSAAVGPWVLAAGLVLLATLITVVHHLPGPRGDQRRRVVYAALLDAALLDAALLDTRTSTRAPSTTRRATQAHPVQGPTSGRPTCWRSTSSRPRSARLVSGRPASAWPASAWPASASGASGDEPVTDTSPHRPFGARRARTDRPSR